MRVAVTVFITALGSVQCSALASVTQCGGMTEWDTAPPWQSAAVPRNAWARGGSGEAAADGEALVEKTKKKGFRHAHVVSLVFVAAVSRVSASDCGIARVL